MDEKFLKEIEQKLKKEKEVLEEELKSFAKKNKEIKDDWKTRFPKFDGEERDTETDEVEEYENLLPIEYSLEVRLRNVNRALEKIKKGIYGKCEKCGKFISQERLKICPEARTCKICKETKK